MLGGRSNRRPAARSRRRVCGRSRGTGHRHGCRDRDRQRARQDAQEPVREPRRVRSLAGKLGQGTLPSTPRARSTEVASPVGVVFGVVPVTNPVATAMFKTLIALKGRNALILSFHHGRSVSRSGPARIVRGVLEAHRRAAGSRAVGRRAEDSATTRKLMSHPLVSMILATGGAGLVKAAYSSGTPAIGVGPGNAPVLDLRRRRPRRGGARDRREQNVRQRSDLRRRAQPRRGSTRGRDRS